MTVSSEERLLAFDFQNPAGTTFRIGGGPWAIYLNLAQSFGWEPRGTFLRDRTDWHGGYDSSDGQTMVKEDVDALRHTLLDAERHPQFDFAVSDTIARVEASVEQSGMRIPAGMRNQPQVIKTGLPRLCTFLEAGEFRIL